MDDLCGCEVTLSDSSALDDWNGVISGFLAHSASTPDHLNAVLERDPGCIMALATKGFALLMLGRRELIPAAQDTFRLAQESADVTTLSQRERCWLGALELWLGGRPGKSVECLEKVLVETPHDTLTAKLIHGILFILGDSVGMRASIERVLPAHGPDHPLRGYLIGCHAFALEETGAYAAAEKAGLEGLTYAQDDAWGLHAVAHVYDMTADSARGIDLITQHEGSWLHCNNFRYHVWWHKALLHLDLDDAPAALALYDQKIRQDKTDDYRDIANATSLLQRLELEGHDVGDRWAEIADLSENRAEDGCLVFADLHYMLALAGDKRPDARDQMITRMGTAINDATVDMERITADPGLAAAEGLAAFGEGRYAVAFQNLISARRRMRTIGGSHAQRDVFERMTVDAGLRAGRFADVRSILDERTAQRAGQRDRFAEKRYALIDDASYTLKVAAQ